MSPPAAPNFNGKRDKAQNLFEKLINDLDSTESEQKWRAKWKEKFDSYNQQNKITHAYWDFWLGRYRGLGFVKTEREIKDYERLSGRNYSVMSAFQRFTFTKSEAKK